MEKEHKFWIWICIISLTAVIFFTSILSSAVTTQSRDEQNSIIALVGKGYTANQASCAITANPFVCKESSNEKNFHPKKDDN